MAGAQPAAVRLSALPGMYRGKFPCADCRGMHSTLKLACGPDCAAGDYALTDMYINGAYGNTINNKTGKWVVIERRSGDLVLALDKETNKASYYYIKKDGNLQPLDKRQQPMEVSYDITMRKQ